MNTKLILTAGMASALVASVQTTPVVAQGYDVAKRYESQPLPVPGQFDDTMVPRFKEGTAPHGAAVSVRRSAARAARPASLSASPA
jgi:hypothetical protein